MSKSAGLSGFLETLITKLVLLCSYRLFDFFLRSRFTIWSQNLLLLVIFFSSWATANMPFILSPLRHFYHLSVLFHVLQSTDGEMCWVIQCCLLILLWAVVPANLHFSISDESCAISLFWFNHYAWNKEWLLTAKSQRHWAKLFFHRLSCDSWALLMLRGVGKRKNLPSFTQWWTLYKY